MQNYIYKDIRSLNQELIGQDIYIEGRVHKIRHTGKLCFIILRYQNNTLQVIACKKDMEYVYFNALKTITKESIIRVAGQLKKTPFPIKATTYTDIEFNITKCELISHSKELPFDIDDVDSNEDFRSNVGQSLRLDNRWLDLRTPVNHSIMFIQSAITNYFRIYLQQNNFIEIHTPKTIGVPSESGAEVFKLDYFGSEAFLAQSPQLYKQMAINADFDRVYEIGPVFRAEKSFSNRHLCEYIGLDLEMTITPNKDYHEVLEFIWSLLIYIFDSIKQNNSKHIETIREKLPFEDPIYTKKPFILDFKEGVKMLQEDYKLINNKDNSSKTILFEQNPLEDLNNANESRLGELVKEKYGVDLFILDKYPTNARPFYTMQDPDNKDYTYSYDIIFRNKEISSGAQRIDDYNILKKNIISNGINPNSLTDYIESFAYGSKPHAGCGFGLERIVMLYLDLENIRQASFCPRDPKRKTP